ncbi:MAG: ATP-dependent helicase HrpB [Wenzhouxiangellaceae bacterium]|nr:ATP-dependent helicase HrpB [Wenzhouxiangellaceae bacterium]
MPSSESATHQPALPVDALLPRLLAALAEQSTAVLQAPPGAGKTTRVPLALLDAPWRGDRKILMLEPRRLAARAAARFMSKSLGEPVGTTVGFRTRVETKVSAHTRIEVVTEGILVRMLQRDPELADCAAVLFDEFHERSLNADLGLALVHESQQALRPGLRIVVMSATLDAEPLAALLEDAPVLTSAGRHHPVDIEYRPPRREQRLPDAVAAAVRHALAHQPGSLLVFLPGVGEIRAVHDRLKGILSTDVDLQPLYGALEPAIQDAAIAPSATGRRKVVLATSIAETSLTIEGIRVVIDAGLERRARFDAGSGMTRLVTRRVSRAAAEQRAGRAGRVEPGVCYRLWSESEHKSLPAFTPPEILEADLAGLVLELAHWGTRDPEALTWLNPPPGAHWNQALELLGWLDALDATGAITVTGRKMLEAGIHPRLAHMLVRSRELGAGGTGARLAALLSERDIMGGRAGADIELRLSAMKMGRAGRGHAPAPEKPADVNRGRIQAVEKLARRLAGDGRDNRTDTTESIDPGALLALAFPDRVAKRRSGGPARFQLSNGKGAWLPDDDPLAGSEWLVAAELDGKAREARIFLAARTDRAAIERALEAHIEETEAAEWDDRRGTVTVRRERRLGALVLERKPAGTPTPELIAQGLLDAVRNRGLHALNWTEAARQLGHRVELMRELEPDGWPPFDPESLTATLDDWLAPFLAGLTHWRQVEKMDLVPALENRLGYTRKQRLDRLAPTRLKVPAGSEVRLDYGAEGGPVLAVKLQAVFGWRATPRIADGRVPVVLHLLSPAGRPLAVTADLESFWANAYPEVARDMRGRYPKHPWPADPLGAAATMRTKNRRSRDD